MLHNTFQLSSVPGLMPSQNASHSTANGESLNDAGSSHLDNSTTPPSDGQSATTPRTNDQSAPSQPNGDQSATPASGGGQSEAGLVCLRQTEPYRRYFRMLEVGVPEPAVRMKMQQEGLDPDALQRGGELVSDPATAAQRRGSDSEESHAASWESESS